MRRAAPRRTAPRRVWPARLYLLAQISGGERYLPLRCIMIFTVIISRRNVSPRDALLARRVNSGRDDGDADDDGNNAKMTTLVVHWNASNLANAALVKVPSSSDRYLR